LKYELCQAEDDKDEVVINLNSVPESLCLNTSAFIGVTITFVMLLIVAVIVIITSVVQPVVELNAPINLE